MQNTNNTSPFEKRCVAFLDILGFRARVKEAEKNPQKAQTLDQALEKISKLGTAKEHFIDSVKVTIFSDSVVISVNDDIDEIKLLIERLTIMLWTLMLDGIWMRGGLTIGDLSTSKDRPWGPAFIEAYDTETTLANYPRVVVSRELYEQLKNEIQNDTTPVKRDKTDGVYFLDIIGQGVKKNKDSQIGFEKLTKIKKHLDQEHAKNMDNPNVYQKFSWLRKEWDQTLGQHNGNDALEPYFSVTRQHSAGLGENSFNTLPKLT